MARYGNFKRAFGMSIVFMFTAMAFHGLVIVKAEQQVEETEVILYNERRNTDICMDYSNPDVLFEDMWPDRPNGIYYGPTTIGSIYELDHYITEDNDYVSMGWYFTVSSNRVQGGVAKLWLKGPIVTNPGDIIFSNIKIYEVNDYNSSKMKGDLLINNSILPGDINPINNTNGYISQLENWGKLVNLNNGPGDTLGNRYWSFFDLTVPIYPEKFYYIEQNVSYKKPSNPFKPEISVSSEDICYDNIYFTNLSYGKSVSSNEINLTIEPDYAMIFEIAHTKGHTLLPLEMEPGDFISFSIYTFHTPSNAFANFIFPLYPLGGLSNWTITTSKIWSFNMAGAGLGLREEYWCVNDTFVDVSDGGIMHTFDDGPGSVDLDWAIQVNLTFNFLYSDPNSSLTIFLPVMERDNYWGHFEYRSFGRNRSIGFGYGYLRYDTAIVGTNITTGLYVYDVLPPTYDAYYERLSILSFIGGVAVNGDGNLWNSVKGVAGYALFAVSPIAGTLNWIFNGGLSPGNLFPAMGEITQAIFDAVGGAMQYVGEAIVDAGQFVIGKFIDTIQWVWDSVKSLFSPILEVFHEIINFVTEIIDGILDAIQMIIGVVMKVVSTICCFALVPFIAGAFLIPLAINKFTRKHNPGSSKYIEIQKEWDAKKRAMDHREGEQ